MKRGNHMSYETRLRFYEAEKKILGQHKLTPRKYEEAVKRLAEKWRI